MSNQWEVVVRHRRERKNQNTDKKLSENIQKPEYKVSHDEFSKVSPPPDFENKENEKVVPKEKPKKSQPKKQNEKKKTDVEKIKQPKTLEKAISLIGDEELKMACETMALSDVTRFLNSKITVDQNDEVYSKLPLDYPLSIVPLQMKREIETAIIKETQHNSLHYCVEFCLSSIAYNMIKGLPVTGYKLMIQFIAESNSSCFTKCIPKLLTLMNSFQNRPQIGSTLLWAIGQGGLRNFSIGYQAWKEVMVPMIDMKHYHKCVVNYLVVLLSAHTNAKGTLNIKPIEFFEIFSFIHTKRKSLPKDLEKTLNSQSVVLRELYFNKSESWKNLNSLDKLLGELPNTYYRKRQSYDFKNEEYLKCIIDALSKDDSNFEKLISLNTKFTKESSHIPGYIDSHWKTLHLVLKKNSFSNYITRLKTIYQEMLSSNKNEVEINDALQACQNLSDKATGSKGFPWVTGCFVLLVAIIGALIAYDVTQAGSFQKSHTRVITDTTLGYVQYGTSKGLAASARGYKWAEKNAPFYITNVVEFSKPYVELSYDMALIVTNQIIQLYNNIREYSIETWPKVYSTIDHYAPGFLEKVQEFSLTAWKSVKNVSCQYCETVSTYLKTKVFVDNWAPEKLQERTLQALNTTQLYAAEYYKWFYKHVDDYSKL